MLKASNMRKVQFSVEPCSDLNNIVKIQCTGVVMCKAGLHACWPLCAQAGLSLHRLTSVCTDFVVVVALLFYVHGKHLRSCRDGQLT